jgi:DNA-binding beta-propeller fold protein YncE
MTDAPDELARRSKESASAAGPFASLLEPQDALARGSQLRRAGQRRHRTGSVLGALILTIGIVLLLPQMHLVHYGSSGSTAPVNTPSLSSPTYLVGTRLGGPEVLVPFNPVTGHLGKTIEAGDSYIAPGDHEALELDTGGDLVYPIDLTSGHVGPAIRVGLAPVAVAYSPDGQMAYVADAGAAAFAGAPGGVPGPAASNQVTPVDLQSGRALPPITVCRGPTALGLSATTHTLVVTCGKEVALVDTVTDRMIRLLDIGGLHRGIIAISPSGKEAVVGDTDVGNAVIPSGDIVPIDLVTATASAPIPIGGNTGVGGSLGLVFVAGSDRYLYVTTGAVLRTKSYEMVLRVDLQSRTVSSPLRLGGALVSKVHVWPDGTTGYVAPVSGDNASLYRVGLSLHSSGHVVQLKGYGPLFSAEAPYLCSLAEGHRQVTVANMQSGRQRVIALPFFPRELVDG